MTTARPTALPASLSPASHPDPDSLEPAFLERADLAALVAALRDDGRAVIGPTVRDGAVILDEITSVDELPVGVRETQAPGHYRLGDGRPDRIFDFTVGPMSPKGWTFPARVPIGTARRTPDGATFSAATPDARPLAFLGVRACELAALDVQDRVLLRGPVADHDYDARRRSALIVSVECTTAATTCFCTSMGTGPEVRDGADLVLTETTAGFVVRTGSERGRDLLARLPVRPATDLERDEAAGGVAEARAAVSANAGVATTGLPGRLGAALDHPRWAEVAERCLTCGNCTLVCPTCFCTSVEQVSDLEGTETTTNRAWASCFSAEFAAVAGGTFRSRPQDRYRQWLTHKFSTWVDQFGTSGCVGCGRCVTWCPVGIDVREELAAIAPPPRQALPVLPIAPSPVPDDAWLRAARVLDSRRETDDVVTMTVAWNDAPRPRPGQFVMIGLPGYPAAPISVSRVHDAAIELTIRAAGPATTALTRLGPGEEVGRRGPLGRGWPVERMVGRDIVIVAGGIGLAPLRPLIDSIAADRLQFGAVRIFLGARTPRDRLFTAELAAWTEAGLLVDETVDRAGADWLGRVGVVTHLFDHSERIPEGTIAAVCGPERMMEATADVLRSRGLTDDRILVTLERHMDCGVGLCGHCQLGRFFVCRDGPVFSLAELGDAFGREGR
jgi:NAD(P)H-flavin reductase